MEGLVLCQPSYYYSSSSLYGFWFPVIEATAATAVAAVGGWEWWRGIWVAVWVRVRVPHGQLGRQNPGVMIEICWPALWKGFLEC